MESQTQSQMFQILDEKKAKMLRHSPEWEMLGEWYPDYGLWGIVLTPILSFEREECRQQNLLWLNGLCFSVPFDATIDFYREKRVSDGIIIYNYYAKVR